MPGGGERAGMECPSASPPRHAVDPTDRETGAPDGTRFIAETGTCHLVAHLPGYFGHLIFRRWQANQTVAGGFSGISGAIAVFHPCPWAVYS